MKQLGLFIECQNILYLYSMRDIGNIGSFLGSGWHDLGAIFILIIARNAW